MAIFVKDYNENSSHIKRELRELQAMLSGCRLALDHQRKAIRRTLGKGVVGYGGQTFTICGDTRQQE